MPQKCCDTDVRLQFLTGKKRALYKGCIFMESSNSCGGLEPPVLRFHSTEQHLSSPKLRFANIPRLNSGFFGHKSPFRFSHQPKIQLEFSGWEVCAHCAQWWAFFCNMMGKLLFKHEMCQAGTSNKAHSSDFSERGLNNRGDGGKGRKRPLLCSKTGEMFEYPKLRVKLVQNTVICCRVWISAPANLSQGRSERESAGPFWKQWIN